MKESDDCYRWSDGWLVLFDVLFGGCYTGGVRGWGGDLLLISSYTLYHQLSERGHTEDTTEL